MMSRQKKPGVHIVSNKLGKAVVTEEALLTWTAYRRNSKIHAERGRLEPPRYSPRSAEEEWQFWVEYSKIHEPPRHAEWLLIALASSRHAEAAIGDLNEQYANDYLHFGAARAARLYWARTIRSIGPLLLRLAGKALKWGAVIAAVKRLF
jgi:hypothetical protein